MSLESSSAEELYSLNLVPSEFFLKFREELQGFRVGVNFEFYNLQFNESNLKLVFKPLRPEKRWKLIYEPQSRDVRIVTKKIPITRYFNIQVGVGHNFNYHSTGWKWKLTTCLGVDGVSHVRSKASLSLLPGFDLRAGWKAEYILPEIQGAMGTGEPALHMNFGKLYASLDRVEAIVTHTTSES